jgi:hypothetical protein
MQLDAFTHTLDIVRAIPLAAHLRNCPVGELVSICSVSRAKPTPRARDTRDQLPARE